MGVVHVFIKITPAITDYFGPFFMNPNSLAFKVSFYSFFADLF